MPPYGPQARLREALRQKGPKVTAGPTAEEEHLDVPSQSQDDAEAKASRCLSAARLKFSKREDPVGALVLAETARKLWLARGDKCQEAAALRLVADLEIALGRPEQALVTVRTATSLYTECKDLSREASSLCVLAKLCTAKGALEEASEAGQRAERLYQELADREGEATVLLEIVAPLQEAKGEWRLAALAAKEAALVLRRAGSRKEWSAWKAALQELLLRQRRSPGPGPGCGNTVEEEVLQLLQEAETLAEAQDETLNIFNSAHLSLCWAKVLLQLPQGRGRGRGRGGPGTGVGLGKGPQVAPVDPHPEKREEKSEGAWDAAAPAEAESLAERALQQLEELGAAQGVEEALRLLARVRLQRGRSLLAAEAAGRAAETTASRLLRLRSGSGPGHGQGGFDEGLAASQSQSQSQALAEEAEARTLLAEALRTSGQAKQACEEAQRAVGLAQAAGDAGRAAAACRSAASAQGHLRQWPGALAALQQAMELSWQAHDGPGAAQCLCQLAEVQASAGAAEAALQAAEEAVALAEELGEPYAKALASHTMARTILMTPEGEGFPKDGSSLGATIKKAACRAAEAIGIFRELDDRRQLALSLHTLAVALTAGLGDAEQALQAATEARRLFQQLGDAWSEAAALLQISAAQFRRQGQGLYREAAAAAGAEAEQLYQRLGSPDKCAAVRAMILRLQRGDRVGLASAGPASRRGEATGGVTRTISAWELLPFPTDPPLSAEAGSHSCTSAHAAEAGNKQKPSPPQRPSSTAVQFNRKAFPWREQHTLSDDGVAQVEREATRTGNGGTSGAAVVAPQEVPTVEVLQEASQLPKKCRGCHVETEDSAHGKGGFQDQWFCRRCWRKWIDIRLEAQRGKGGDYAWKRSAGMGTGTGKGGRGGAAATLASPAAPAPAPAPAPALAPAPAPPGLAPAPLPGHPAPESHSAPASLSVSPSSLPDPFAPGHSGAARLAHPVAAAPLQAVPLPVDLRKGRGKDEGETPAGPGPGCGPGKVGMTLLELFSAARGARVDPLKVSAAMDSADPKAALLNLLVVQGVSKEKN